MEPQQTPMPPPPSLSTTATTTTTTTTTVPPTYPDSLDSSPSSRNTDSWGEENNNKPNHSVSNNGTTTTTTAPQQQPSVAVNKLRLMCSYGGHIVPRPHDKSLCYVGGDTRIVVVDRQTTLPDLTNRLSKILLRSSSSSLTSVASNATATASFTLKYQLPSEDLDSLISVTTDEDLENMIDEYERLNCNNSSGDVSKTSRLRLFLFPTKPESVTSIGSLLENSTKSEDWFLNALNGTTSGFSDTSSVNCLLGLDDDVLVPEKKDDNKGSGVIGNNLKVNYSGQDVHSVPDLERTSSFGSASSSPSLASLPPIRVHVDDNPNQKAGGIEEQFVQMSVQQQVQKQQQALDDGGYVAVSAPVVVTGVPLSSPVAAAVPIEFPNRVLSEDERSDQGSQHGYQKVVVQQQQQYQQQKQFDLASQDSVSSDGRPKPAMIYQDPMVQMQASKNNNRANELNSLPDQNTIIQMQQQQQQQQIADSAYLMSMSNTQVDPQHPQMHHQQPQFIHTGVPQPQYIHHHPSGAVPMASYYQMYPSQNQHQHHHQPLDQQNFVYYMPARQAPHGYNLPMQQQQQSSGYADVSSAGATPLSQNQLPQPAYTTNRPTQTAPKSDLPGGVYGTTSSGNPQFVQVPNQPQPQPQYVGYSQMHHPSQSIANSVSGGAPNYGYEFTDPAAQGQHIYYAAQPMPPQQMPSQSSAQYQTVSGESGSYIPADNSTKQQQGRTQQP
ncbi:uncharacterized protein [Rutidosis leptorrhynchoides]|uniref:uncharacterized protein n=1 Tax=Rutidosis leptorrhynchoides TaxID=125765 RepID=UPI003A99FCFE